MRRGDLVTVVIQGDFGKPRPAMIIQSDLFLEHDSVTVLPLSSFINDIHAMRVTLTPNEENGLEKQSQVAIDKLQTILRSKIGPVFGKVDHFTIVEIERRLTVFLGIA